MIATPKLNPDNIDDIVASGDEFERLALFDNAARTEEYAALNLSAGHLLNVVDAGVKQIGFGVYSSYLGDAFETALRHIGITADHETEWDRYSLRVNQHTEHKAPRRSSHDTPSQNYCSAQKWLVHVTTEERAALDSETLHDDLKDMKLAARNRHIDHLTNVELQALNEQNGNKKRSYMLEKVRSIFSAKDTAK
ncbi:hypothetical protein BDV96DRAFT_649846 [Lophiotrema nucula]|uniref:Uncharacterized protein n=1 Tax=Lophiotrema nucula TaxID=690887 RepID=A0A6A5Z0G3_9PLEO|nr:hypothetical protein BDV96DRAFT_649846 [Lophiotrema nucula]